MNDIEKIISEFDFFNIRTEAELQTEIADMIYLTISSTYEVINPMTNKIWLADDFYKEILPHLKGDLQEGYFFNELIKCAKKIYNLEKIEDVFNKCQAKINRAFDELGIVIVNSFSDIFEMLEIKNLKIVFPEKWFIPAIYKIVTEFLKTFKCERCKLGKQTAFKNQGEFSNEQILQIGKNLKGVSLSTKFDFFPTPHELVQKVQLWADIKENDVVLEPSAGTGDLISGLNKKNIVCIEINPILSEILVNKGFKYVYNCAFEDYKSSIEFDKIIMNPPFSKRLDAKHIKLAFEKLKKRRCACCNSFGRNFIFYR